MAGASGLRSQKVRGHGVWRRALQEVLAFAAQRLPPGSRVLDVGFGNGDLTLHLARCYGWRVTGLETSLAAWRLGRQRLDESPTPSVELRLVRPWPPIAEAEKFDAVFIKTVLYEAADLREYAASLAWVHAALRSGGLLINFENGRGHILTRWYRTLRRRPYRRRCLYEAQVEKLYHEYFHLLHTAHYGLVSQFFGPLRWLYALVAGVEERIVEPTADNAFVNAVVGRRRD